ncbi:hypothetical protein KEM54_000598 [Ascosphaera aggregata]|nr:hypothetical protein KEM54_000598 [Ascosphaera aggregata]
MSETAAAPLSRRRACEHLVRRIQKHGPVFYKCPLRCANNVGYDLRVQWVFKCFKDLCEILFWSPLSIFIEDWKFNVKLTWASNQELEGTCFGVTRVSEEGMMVHAYFVLACSYRGHYDDRGYGYEVEHDIAFCVLLETINCYLSTDIEHDDLLYCKPEFMNGGKRGHRLPKALASRIIVPPEVGPFMSDRVYTDDSESDSPEDKQFAQRRTVGNRHEEPAESHEYSQNVHQQGRNDHKYNDLESHRVAPAESGTPESSWGFSESSSARERRRRDSYEERRRGKRPARQPQADWFFSESSDSMDETPNGWFERLEEAGEPSGYRPHRGGMADRFGNGFQAFIEPFNQDSLGPRSCSPRQSNGQPRNASLDQEAISPRTSRSRNSLENRPSRGRPKSPKQASEHSKPTRPMSDPVDYTQGRDARSGERPPGQPSRDSPIGEIPSHPLRRQASEQGPSQQRRRLPANVGFSERPTNIEGRRKDRRHFLSELFAPRPTPQSHREPSPVGRNRPRSRERRSSVPEERIPGRSRRVHRWSRHRIRVHDEEEEWFNEDDGRGHCSHRHHKRRSASNRRRRGQGLPDEPRDGENSVSSAGRSDSLSDMSELPDDSKGWKMWKKWRANRHSRKTLERQMRDCEICTERRERQGSRRRPSRIFNAAKELLPKK